MTPISKFQETLGKEESAVLFSPVSRRYLTGFASSDGALFVTREEVRLYLDPRYLEMAQIRQSRGEIEEKIRLCPTPFWNEWQTLSQEGKLPYLLYEDTRLTVFQLENMKKSLPKTQFLPLGRRVEEMRQVKGEDQIRRLRASQALAEEAFSFVLPLLNEEKTETFVAAQLEYYMRLHGAKGPSFATICVSGTKTSLPHGVPEDKKLGQGFVTMDFGCDLDGYMSDMTRTVCIGRATEEMRLVYHTVLEAQLAALETIRAGIPGCRVDRAARDVIEKAGFGAYFGHSTGHGVGLEVHEAPNFAPRTRSLIPAGAVVSVEPGIYLPGRFGVRIEDLVVVREEGYENLNRLGKELLEI